MFSALQGGGQGVVGQVNPCYTPTDLPNYLQNVTFSPSATARIMSNEPYVVRIAMHIIRRDDGTGGRNFSDIYQAFNFLQNIFYSHGIYFKLDCVDVIDNTQFYNASVTSQWKQTIVQFTTAHPTSFNTLNFFIQDVESPIGVNPVDFGGGFTTSIPGKNIRIGGRTGGRDFLLSYGLAHEVGHALGLFHTFHGSCGEPFVVTAPNEPCGIGSGPCQELAQQGTCENCDCLSTQECATTCNCCTCGDFVCDTNGSDRLVNIFGSVANCNQPTYIAGCVGIDALSNSYSPQLNNIMNYTHVDCMTTFTEGQVKRMRSHLEAIIPCNDITITSILANINTDGYTLANFTLPTGNNIWDTPRHIIGKITVPNNATLTISNTTVAFEGTAAGITVEKGGRLIIDHAILRDNACTATPWQGITVKGNGFVPHPANYLSTNSANHGIVVIKNGSVIENAQFGIYTSEQNTSALGFTEYTGGGIIDVQNSTLRNNLVGIHIGHFYGYDPLATGTTPANAQRSQVLNNTFINTAPYLGNPAAPYTHLYLNRSQSVRVDGNTFQCQANTGFTTQTRGTGVVATNTSTTIGSNTLALSNTFINLYKGVDIYNTLSAVSVTNVVRNQFLETDKAITLNTVPYATIEKNIIDVKTGSSTNDTYGILTTGSFGFDIVNNFLNSNAPEGNLYTKGIVVQQSYYTNTLNDAALSRDNAFSGRFAAGTQIEGNCQNLQLQCSVYLSANKYDWYIAQNYPYLNNAPVATLLDAQGACNAENQALSFATVWHTPATGTYHIKNNAVAPITINYDIDSNPTATNGNVIKNSCSGILGIPIDNTTCAYPDPANPPGGDVCCTNGIACQSGIDVARRIRYLIKQNDQQGVVSFLTCIDQVWAYRLLVATLIDQRQLTEALSTLLRIPDDSPDNIAFKATCNAVINNLLNGSSSGGRTNQSYLQSLRTMAQMRQGSNTLLTESYLAALEGNRYVRTSAPIEDDKTENNQTTLNQLTVVPNPAQNYVQIICGQEVPNAKLLVYDLNGRLLKTANSTDNITFIIDTSALPTGIYYCTVASTTYTAKLIVVK